MSRAFTIVLSTELYRELELAAAEASSSAELGGPISPSVFARECVEAALASRRLDRIIAEKLPALNFPNDFVNNVEIAVPVVVDQLA